MRSATASPRCSQRAGYPVVLALPDLDDAPVQPTSADWPGWLAGAFVMEAIELVFYGDGVTGADRDRLTSARIAAITRRHVRGRPLTGLEEAAALAELAEVADGRIDLLAQEAGLAIHLALSSQTCRCRTARSSS